MSGVTISGIVTDQDVISALRRYQYTCGNLTALLKNIGEYKVEATQRLFDSQAAPDGTPWAALSPAYRKRKKNKRILTETRRLRDSIVYAVRSGNLRVGTNVVYASAHQFGLKRSIVVPAHRRAVTQAFGRQLKFPVWTSVKAHTMAQNIPSRPFLGWNQSDRQEIIDQVTDHLQR